MYSKQATASMLSWSTLKVVIYIWKVFTCWILIDAGGDYSRLES